MNNYFFIEIQKEEDESFKDFIKRSFKTHFNIILTYSKLNKLDSEILNNVIVIDNYEYNIEKISIEDYQIKRYKINKDKNIKFIFGCELETCILTECSSQKYLDALINSKNETVDKEKYWTKLVKSYIKNTIFPNIDENFIKKFKYGYIMINPKDNFINFIIDFKNKSININKDKDLKNDYRYLIFTRDSSLICGDTLHKYELAKEKLTKEKIYKNSFHCEVVTPILKDITDIKILYYNLFKSNCFRGNESAAFHVNVSMLDKENEPIFFSKGFLDCFLDLYEKYELENYYKYRPNGSWYAKRIREYSINHTFKYIKNILNFKNSEQVNYFYENFLEGKKFYRSFIEFEGTPSAKYNSIHTKNNNIIEFRLFPTEDTKDILTEYILDSIKLLRKANDIYSENFSQIVNKLQKLNTEVKITYEPLIFYEGYIYIYDKNIREYIECKDFKDVFYGLEVLLEYHYQKILSYSVKNKDVFNMIIYNEIKEINENFIFEYQEDGYVKLFRL